MVKDPASKTYIDSATRIYWNQDQMASVPTSNQVYGQASASKAHEGPFQFDESDLVNGESLWLMYNRWIAHHDMVRSAEEKAQRFPIFAQNAKECIQHRKANIGSTVGLNGFGDMTYEEITARSKCSYTDPDDGRQRFLLELEFVQCLANPTYIHYLAQNRYFEDEAFVGYLQYLQYWQRPEYIKFIMYPHCLFFLELLQNPNFRSAMAHPANKELAHRQQFYFWKNYRNNRLKHILPKPAPESDDGAPSSIPLPSLPSTNVTPTLLPAPPQLASSIVAQAPMPMQYGVNPRTLEGKNDPRNTSVDRRKRK